LERDIDAVTEEEIALLDGHPFLPPGVEPWIKPLAVYMRRVTINGTRVEPEEGRSPKRGGARHPGFD
jgi:hypothetical protein